MAPPTMQVTQVASLQTKVATLRTELGLPGKNLVETVEKAVREVGLPNADALSLMQKVDACLQTIGTTVVDASPNQSPGSRQSMSGPNQSPGPWRRPSQGYGYYDGYYGDSGQQGLGSYGSYGYSGYARPEWGGYGTGSYGWGGYGGYGGYGLGGYGYDNPYGYSGRAARAHSRSMFGGYGTMRGYGGYGGGYGGYGGGHYGGYDGYGYSGRAASSGRAARAHARAGSGPYMQQRSAGPTWAMQQRGPAPTQQRGAGPTMGPTQELRVKVPQNRKPGDRFTVATSRGGRFEVVVPSGLEPGEKMSVTVPM